MMKRMAPAAVLAAGMVLALAGCTNPYDPGQRAVGGGLLGAGAGAAIGGAVGGGRGAGIGAAIGGATGAITGAATTPAPPPPPGYGGPGMAARGMAVRAMVAVRAMATRPHRLRATATRPHTRVPGLGPRQLQPEGADFDHSARSRTFDGRRQLLPHR